MMKLVWFRIYTAPITKTTYSISVVHTDVFFHTGDINETFVSMGSGPVKKGLP